MTSHPLGHGFETMMGKRRPDSRWGALDDKNAYVFSSYCRYNPIILLL